MRRDGARAEQRARGGRPAAWASSLFAAGGLLAILAATISCGRPSDIPIVATESEYSDLLQKAQGLSEGALERYEKGEKPGEKDMRDLREALKIFDGLIAFNPNAFGAYFGAGKIHQALGEPEIAMIDMQKFVAYAPKSPTDDVKRLLAEANYVCAKQYETNGDFELAGRCAAEAVKWVRKNPDYLAMLASAKLREKDAKGARSLVDEALKLDPENGRAKQLRSLMGSGRH